jgi:hypothetical protein
MQQKLHRIGALVVAEQDRRLAVGELERRGAGAVLAPGAVEVTDHRAVLAAAYPGVAGAKLELREARVRLDRADGIGRRLDIETVHVSRLLGDHLLTHHRRSPRSGGHEISRPCPICGGCAS